MAEIQVRFLAILPKIENHARYTFRYIRCYHAREDAIAETVALCWLWYRRLVDQANDPARFPSVLASYATRQVKSGRRLCGQESARDALSPAAQQRNSFTTTKLPDISPMVGSPLTEALQDNTQSPVPEQVHFRVDFPVWRRSLPCRTSQVADAMMLGHRTLDLADQFKLSPARISQLRRDLRDSWEGFIGDRDIQRNPQPAA